MEYNKEKVTKIGITIQSNCGQWTYLSNITAILLEPRAGKCLWTKIMMRLLDSLATILKLKITIGEQLRVLCSTKTQRNIT